MTERLLEKIDQRTIFLTGGSSGIGYQASIELLKEGHKLILPCRDSNTASKTKTNLIELTGSVLIETPVADLSDLRNINKLAAQLNRENKFIDTIALNAGLQYTGSKTPRRSAQGYELTISVNHLAHQALTQLLLKLLKRSLSPKIVITSSEVHDPKSAGGSIGAAAGLGNLKGLKNERNFNMIDGISSFNADKAYKDSKLCNILFARELSQRIISQGRNIPVITWAPGLVIPRVTGGFFRYSREYNQIGQRVFAIIARDILRITEDVKKAGLLLKTLCSSTEYYQKGFSFYSNKLIRPGKFNFQKSLPSAESLDTLLASDLWLSSSKLLEIGDKLDLG